MKWIKDNWLLIVAIIAIGIFFVYISNCGANAELKEAKKAHEEIIQKIEQEKQAIIEEEKKKNLGEIEALRHQIAVDETDRIKRNKEITELKKSIQNIPQRTVPFTQLEEAQKEYNFLEIDYIKRGVLIVKLELKIVGLEKTKSDYVTLELKYNKQETLWENDKAAWQEKEIEYIRYTKELERKYKKPLFTMVLGGGVNHHGQFGISLTFGIDVLGILNIKL